MPSPSASDSGSRSSDLRPAGAQRVARQSGVREASASPIPLILFFTLIICGAILA